MDRNLEKANWTAIEASEAMIKIFDFAASILEELSRGVEESSGLRVGKYDRVRLSTQDVSVIKRYTNPRSKGESRVQRYIYCLFSQEERSDGACFPFILISLVNAEKRAPSAVYGTVHRISGVEKTDKDFCEYFMLWINEQLKEICLPEHEKEYGWEVRQELAGKAEANRLKARVSVQTTGLFDITEETLSERAKTIAKWFNDRLGLTAGTAASTR